MCVGGGREEKSKKSADAQLLSAHGPSFKGVAGRVGGNIILLMLEFNSFSSSNFLSS